MDPLNSRGIPPPSDRLRWSPWVFRRRRPERLGRDFWLVVAASTLTCLVNGAATPLLARYARINLGAPRAVVGLVVGASSIATILLRPVLGRFADRQGVRRAAIIGASALIGSGVILMVARSTVVGGVGRGLMGLCTGLANTALTTWTIDLAPEEQSGRALGLFGLSVWVGLAAGPLVGQALVTAGGYDLLWIGCGVLGLLAAALLLPTRPPLRRATRRTAAHGGLGLLRSVSVAGTAAGIAWAGESVVLAYLVIHLEAHGVPGGGVTGAASVLSVFALSVVAGRLVLVGLVDRIGPARAAAGALIIVGLGLAVLALSRSWAAAALGALVLGAGFSPLYPALILLASEDLAAGQRATGVAVFGAFTDAGVGGGAILGGVVIAVWGSTAAFALIAAAQLPAAALIVLRRVQRSSSRAGLATSIAWSADSDTPERASSGTTRRSRWS